MALKRGIERAVEVVVEEVKKFSKSISGDMIAQVGTHLRQRRLPPSATPLPRR